MADYGASDTSTTALGTNQFPISEVYVPNVGLKALGGGSKQTDVGGKDYASALMSVQDGGDATQGLTTDAAVTGDSAGTLSAKLRGLLKIFTDVWDSVNHRIKVDGSGVTQPVSASSLPLPTGAATSAKQPALGTAGSASSDVLSVQGIASMTALKVDGSAVTQPVSAASLPLPTGAATEAGHLATIDTSTAAVNTTTGAKGDAAATDSTSSWSAIALLKGLYAKLTGTLTVSGAVTQSGTWTIQPGNTANTTPWLVQDVVSTSGGATPSHTISAASTNATSLKASAGQVYNLQVSNTNAAARYFRFYNLATSPTVGSSTVAKTLQVPASGTLILAWPGGLQFTTGIAWAATGAMGDSDTTAIGAGDLSVDIDYK